MSGSTLENAFLHIPTGNPSLSLPFLPEPEPPNSLFFNLFSQHRLKIQVLQKSLPECPELTPPSLASPQRVVCITDKNLFFSLLLALYQEGSCRRCFCISNTCMGGSQTIWILGGAEIEKMQQNFLYSESQTQHLYPYKHQPAPSRAQSRTLGSTQMDWAWDLLPGVPHRNSLLLLRLSNDQTGLVWLETRTLVLLGSN